VLTPVALLGEHLLESLRNRGVVIAAAPLPIQEQYEREDTWW